MGWFVWKQAAGVYGYDVKGKFDWIWKRYQAGLGYCIITEIIYITNMKHYNSD